MSLTGIASVFFAFIVSLPAQDSISQEYEKEVIHQEKFDKDLSKWVVEQAPGGTVDLVEEKLVINDAKGCTVWFRQKLSGPILIEYEAKLISEGGKHDRVSDLNCFWMATDPNDPEDIFTNKERGGIFKNYHSLKLYYVGYGANKNTTTRFRRYAGGGDRPVLPEHDLKEEKFLNQANQTIKIQILSDGDKNQFYRNGELVFSFKDELPYTQGWFGFRTVRNHLQLDNFKVYELVSKKGIKNSGG